MSQIFLSNEQQQELVGADGLLSYRLNIVVQLVAAHISAGQNPSGISLETCYENADEILQHKYTSTEKSPPGIKKAIELMESIKGKGGKNGK